MNPFFYSEEAGAKGLPPLSPAPPIPAEPASATLTIRLTIPNTYSTITMPASLRSDCCSPSLRNAVRLPSGIDVHLHRNTQKSLPMRHSERPGALATIGLRADIKMPQISSTEFHAIPLRVHPFLADIPLHDVWAVDLPTHRDGVTLSAFLSQASQGGINRLPPVAGALIRFRVLLGRIFRLEAEPKDALAASFESRLTPEDRARSLVAAGTREGPFRVVYRFENEQLLEIQNRTVHGAALSALAKRADAYRFYFAIYVRRKPGLRRSTWA
jgi:hypothetical protein